MIAVETQCLASKKYSIKHMSHPEFSDLVIERMSDYVKICFPSVETQ